VAINIESREYNGKWYTDVRAWKIETSQDVQENYMPTEPPPFIADNENLPPLDIEREIVPF
jgi:hypothetical protein